MSRRRESERYWVHSQVDDGPTTALCVLPVCSTDHARDCRLESCQGCHRGPGDDGMLCRPHKRRLFGRLRSIPELYEKLELEAVEGTPPPSPRSARGQASMPLSASVLDVLRTEAEHLNGLESMEGWCRIVIEERRLAGGPNGGATIGGRLAAACGFLRTHLDWIATQPWVDELDNEAAILARTLRHAVEPEGRWRGTRIRCQIETCAEGLLSWDLLDPANPVLVCKVCGDTWQPEAFWRLAEHTSNPVSLRDAEQIGLASYTDLRNWLRRGTLPNHGTDGAPRVLLMEVLAARRTLERRA